MKKTIPLLIVILFTLLTACGGKGNKGGNFPDEFATMNDQQKVAYMMKHVSADSVARFIIYASLGKIDGVRIDTINIATLTAYENYTDTALQSFSWEFDRLSEELPLADKMRLRAMVGQEDPQGLGLTLGLEYMNQIRIKEMSAADVKKELQEFKKACAADPDTYARFLIGFRTVLNYDRNSDMPKEIYNTFLTYDEAAVKEYYSRNKSVHPMDTSIQDTIPSDILPDMAEMADVPEETGETEESE